MSMSHADVVKNYALRKPNRRWGGSVTWNGRNVNCRGNTIYSYGWWPMAYYLGQEEDKHIFLKRGERYSPSTSTHQAYVQRYCSGPTISFNALTSAGVDAECIALDNIVDWTPDERFYVTREDGRYTRYGDPWAPPSQGMFIPVKEHDDGMYGYWHILGGVLIQAGPDRYLLCALDEDTYFVSELSSPANSVKEAFEGLKPLLVQAAEADGLDVKRQGEWFFVPTQLTDRDIADMGGYKYLKDMRKVLETGPLTRLYDPFRPQTNKHLCKHIVVGPADLRTGELPGRRIFAKGMVRHVTSYGNATGEHKPVRLGDVWHVAVPNTEVASWSVSGRFD